jgi:hypothetical protein
VVDVERNVNALHDIHRLNIAAVDG